MLELDLRMTEEERLASLMEQLDKLTPSTKDKVESLYDSDPDGSAELKVSRIFKGNSIQSKSCKPDKS